MSLVCLDCPFAVVKAAKCCRIEEFQLVEQNFLLLKIDESHFLPQLSRLEYTEKRVVCADGDTHGVAH